MFHSTELEIIQFVQQLRTPLLDAFFKFLNLFDRQEFFFILIPAFWLGKNWKIGLRLFYILFLSALTNHVLKDFFHSPRPFHLDPTLGIIQVGGYGFPSGAAQTVVLLSGILLTTWKNRWKWPVALLYITFISFSRVYLGVHFPTDILAGWVVGLGLWLVYTYARPPLEKHLINFKPFSLLILSQLLPLLLFCGIYSPSVICSGGCGCAMGAGFGLWVNHARNWSLPPSTTKIEFALRAFIGILGTFFCAFLIAQLPIRHSPIPRLLQFFFLGLWLSTGGLLCCRLSKLHVRKDA